jgi:hypothetical protein
MATPVGGATARGAVMWCQVPHRMVGGNMNVASNRGRILGHVRT